MRKALTILSLRKGTSRQMWAAFSLALFLFVQLLASSEALHKLVHADADSAGHHCAVTMLLSGQVSAPEALVTAVAFSAAFLFFLPPFASPVFSLVDNRLSPSRAPPRR